MNEMEKLQVMELPVLVGISRKSMIYKLLGTDQSQALNGTTMLNTVSLMKGASILRVHDVKEAMECVKMYKALKSS
jgi:dihydropteroate synthase